MTRCVICLSLLASPYLVRYSLYPSTLLPLALFRCDSGLGSIPVQRCTTLTSFSCRWITSLNLLQGGLPWWPSQERIHLPMQETWVQSLGGEIPWRRAWQPTLVFLPGESHGQRSLVGYSPWGHKVLDMTKVTENTCKRKKRNEYFILSLFWEQRRSRKQWAGLNIPSIFT